MIMTEVKGNLFSAPQDHYFAHCISGDYALGAGIAKTFNAKFNMRKKLQMMYPVSGHYTANIGKALLVGNTFNLVTKERYWMKPTYHSLRLTLLDMKRQCDARNIKKIAMPKIGCGLDLLDWEYVKQIIQDVFRDTDIEIVVFYL